MRTISLHEDVPLQYVRNKDGFYRNLRHFNLCSNKPCHVLLLSSCRFDNENFRRVLFFFLLHGFSFYAAAPTPGFKTEANNLITKPINPIAPMPNKLILIDSQSSLLPGFVANFKVLAH